MLVKDTDMKGTIKKKETQKSKKIKFSRARNHLFMY